MFRLTILIIIITQTATMQLFQHGLLGELSKWEAVVEHYREHEERQHHHDLVSFLVAHYFGHESDDQDHEEFPCAHYRPSNLIFIAHQYPIHWDFEDINEPAQKHPQPFHPPLIDHYESNGIWHPPSA